MHKLLLFAKPLALVPFLLAACGGGSDVTTAATAT